MRSILTMIGVTVALAALAVAQGPQRSDSEKAPAAPNTAAAASAPASAHPQDEAAIRLVAESFAKAYNLGDAQAIAGLFVAEGEIVNEEGQSTQGRPGIAEVFAGIFKEHPKTHMDLAIGSVRFVGPDMAVEEGMATVTHEPGEPAQHSPYSVVYARQEGKWLTASAAIFPTKRPRPRNSSSNSNG